MVPSAKGAVMPRTSPYRIVLTEDERRHLEAAARRYTSPYREVVRARIVLYAAEGLGNDEIAARLDTPRRHGAGQRRAGLEDDQLAVAVRRRDQAVAGPLVDLPPRPGVRRQGRPGRGPVRQARGGHAPRR